MKQNFSFEGNTITFCLCREGGWGNALKISIITPKKKKERKKKTKRKKKEKKYLFGEASVPIHFTVIICKQDCSTVLGLDSNELRHHSPSSQSSE